MDGSEYTAPGEQPDVSHSTPLSLRETALALRDAGRSPLPIAPGQKAPSIVDHRTGELILIAWGSYQESPAPAGVIKGWFKNRTLMGIGIAAGLVSGITTPDGTRHALEILDVDDEATLQAFLEATNWYGLSELRERLVYERTPKGGGHFGYLCATWEGNQKLAQRRMGTKPDGKPDIVTLIETRGEGGQAVIAPTPPGIHPERPERGYTVGHGSWLHVPIITPDERNSLLTLSRSFNEYTEPAFVHTPPGTRRTRQRDPNRPGDRLNNAADRSWWHDLLAAHGWTCVHQRGEIDYWQRPGKEGRGWSATYGACGEHFYVFSSNAAPFEMNRAYTPFSAYTLLEHDGDFPRAARSLVAEEYRSSTLAQEEAALEAAQALLDQLRDDPDPRHAYEAVPHLTILPREEWGHLKRSLKNMLGLSLNLNDLNAAWKQARRGSSGPPPASASDGGEGDAKTRPVIRISTDMTAVVDATQAAIMALDGGPLIYQHAAGLCSITRNARPPYDLQRAPNTPVIAQATATHLREMAARAAAWEKYNDRHEDWEPTLPPTWVAETLRDRGEWPFPPIVGVIAAPTLRPDGSLLDSPGYDPTTGLYADFDAAAFPSISSAPSQADGQRALKALQEIFADFPFVADHHRSAALAALLSLMGRYLIEGNVPLFAVRATTPGTGKTLLVDAISTLATGRAATRWSPTEDEAEDRKRLLTIVLEGDPLVLIDNVTQPLGSAALDSALTGGYVKDRLLGTNKSATAPFTAVVCATGNNMTFRGDTPRRVVPIDLDANREHPEERDDFTHPHLLAWIRKERSRLVMAALTLLRAFDVAGRPTPPDVKRIGSFEEWSDMIRGALVWAGEADPAAGRHVVQAESHPELEALGTFLEAWHACFQQHPQSLYEALRTIADDAAPGKWHELRLALMGLDARSDGRNLNARSIGNTLRQYNGRILNGYQLCKSEKPTKRGVLWSVVQPGSRGDSGDSGDSLSTHGSKLPEVSLSGKQDSTREQERHEKHVAISVGRAEQSHQSHQSHRCPDCGGPLHLDEDSTQCQLCGETFSPSALEPSAPYDDAGRG
jgi:hypothetical protein